MLREDIKKYISSYSGSEPKDLSAIYGLGTVKNINNSQLSTSPYQGRLLSIISKMIAPNFILDIGTFLGYSACCLAEGLSKKGSLHTIEKNPVDKELIEQIFHHYLPDKSMVFHVGDARLIIPEIKIKWDCVYIDANKKAYLDYFKLVYPRLNKGGIILIDNVLWKGQVCQEDEGVQEKKNSIKHAIVQLNSYISKLKLEEKIILPIDDGLWLIRKPNN